MDIGTVSSNTFIHQISNVHVNKQVHLANQGDDMNFSASLKIAQNIGSNTVRNVEQSREGETSKGLNKDDRKSEERKKTNSKLDIYV